MLDTADAIVASFNGCLSGFVGWHCTMFDESIIAAAFPPGSPEISAFGKSPHRQFEYLDFDLPLFLPLPLPFPLDDCPAFD